jgi:hypothetical protein
LASTKHDFTPDEQFSSNASTREGGCFCGKLDTEGVNNWVMFGEAVSVVAIAWWWPTHEDVSFQRHVLFDLTQLILEHR